MDGLPHRAALLPEDRPRGYGRVLRHPQAGEQQVFRLYRRHTLRLFRLPDVQPRLQPLPRRRGDLPLRHPRLRRLRGGGEARVVRDNGFPDRALQLLLPARRGGLRDNLLYPAPDREGFEILAQKFRPRRARVGARSRGGGGDTRADARGAGGLPARERGVQQQLLYVVLLRDEAVFRDRARNDIPAGDSRRPQLLSPRERLLDTELDLHLRVAAALLGDGRVGVLAHEKREEARLAFDAARALLRVFVRAAVQRGVPAL